MVQAWDLWTVSQQRQFNPDGTLKDRDKMLEKGQQGIVFELERRMKIDIEIFEQTEKEWQEKFGCSFGEWKLENLRQSAKSQQETRKQLIKDIRNGEEISSLSMAIEQDDYLHIQSGYDNVIEDF